MANATQPKFDATRPFYAWIGAGDLAVETLRKAALDVQAQIDTARARSPKSVDEARGIVSDRLDVIVKEAKDAQDKLEGRLAELQSEARAKTTEPARARFAELQAELKALPGRTQARVDELQAEAKEYLARLESRVAELRAELNSTVNEQVTAYNHLAERGETVVDRLRGQVTKAEAAAADVAGEALVEVVEEAQDAKETATRQAAATQRSTAKATVRAAKRVQAAADKVEDAAAQVEAEAAPAADAPVKKTPARKTTARKAPVKKTAPAKAPAKRTTTTAKAPAKRTAKKA